MVKIGIATNKKIIELYNMMQDSTLTINPEFQRNLVWNDKHKEHFIDTILKELPFPEVYFADGDIDLTKKSSTTLVVDGQQRLSTIHQYISESDGLVLKNLKSFSELSDDEQTAFFDYNVVVRDLGRIDSDKVKDIFNRINSVQYALNAMEINNALYEGDYINTAKEISANSNLSRLEIFNENQYARMDDLEFILLVMTTLETGGYFSQLKEIEAYIKQYDNDYPNKYLIENDIISVINLLLDINLNLDSIWLRKSSFFTLIVELIKLKRERGYLPNQDRLYATLIHLEDEIIDNKKKEVKTNKFAKFYNYIYQGTTNRKARIIRGELLEEYLSELT